MSANFHSSKSSIARTKHHLNDFERQVIEFFKTKPYISVIDIDTDTSEKIHKVKLVKPLPVYLPNIAADAIVNLRNALDQAIFAITNSIGAKKTYFPFSSDATNFQATVRGRCKDLPQEITSLISAFKPYKGGNNLLWALNELCNTNKHAIICPSAIAAGGMNITGEFTGLKSMSMPVWDRAKNEMEIFRQFINGTADFNIKVITYVSICNVEFVDGEEANAIFKEFVRIVESIVMALEAECIRLGI